MKPIILASASPRRRVLLESAGVAVRVVTSDAEEISDGPPREVVLINARAKRDAVAAKETDPAIVIAADTEVFFDGVVLGKPLTLGDARGMLRDLSGHTHTVVTGIAAIDTESGRTVEGIEETKVTFRELDAADIDTFVETVQPLDRAGAYTADGPGTLLIERYEGCYTNVLGLPMPRLDALLRELGDGLFQRVDAESARFL